MNEHEHWLDRAYLPRVTSMSVIVCHLFMATNHVCLTRLQLRSMTSLVLSLSRLARTRLRCAREKAPEGKRKEVMMTYGALTCQQQSRTKWEVAMELS